MISHMTSPMINLTQLREFSIITYFKIDLSFIMHYLTYLTFLTNLLNEPYQSIYIELVAPLACNILPPSNNTYRPGVNLI